MGKSTRSSKRRAWYLRRAFLIPTILVVVACVVGSVSWSPQPLNRSASPVLVTPQQPPLKLTKEYIYAGDRLIATEESGLAPPTNLTLIEWCTNRLSWRDNSQNETGFKLELLNADGTWSVDRVLPANTGSTSPVGSKFGPLTYRIRAYNADGDSAPSNSVTVPHVFGACPSGGDPNACTPPTGLIISEFRLNGPLGSNDEYIELTNNTEQQISLCTADPSSGWALVSSDGVIRFVIPNGTVIPARGHYLAVGNGYSVASANASPDVIYPVHIADNSGTALFKTAYPENFTISNRLDAAGFTDSPDLYREGTGLPFLGANGGNYAFLRKLNSGYPQDSSNNSADFTFVATDGGVYAGLQAILGAPGPENLASPIQRNGTLPVTLLDPAVASSVAPNRVRNTSAIGPNAAAGTLSLRRTITNNTGSNVTRLRFRVTDITTLNTPGYSPGGSQADMRLLSSSDFTVTITGGQQILVRGTTLETPPAQAMGGGLNSTVAVGVISLSQPLAPGQRISVQWVLGVQQPGSFRFFANVEALP